MLLFRPVKRSDLDDIYQLASKAGVGLTTMPADRDILAQRIEHSMTSFQKTVLTPQDETYFFVLENLENKKVVGTSAIEAAVGYHLPFYSYRISQATSICHSLQIRNDYQFLSLVNDYQGKTEICSLFLEPAYRNNHNGALLSRSRFIFMAQFPQRFADVIFADMRGVSDDQGNSPFWESLGRHFFQMDFQQADILTMTTDKQFIADLMPRKPIYSLLLSQAAQQVIGKPHESSVRAFNILIREGFANHGYVDIFDAGPTIEAHLNNIATVRNSKQLSIKKFNDIDSPTCIIANTQLTYKATVGGVQELADNGCEISSRVADILEVKIGDTVQIA